MRYIFKHKIKQISFTRQFLLVWVIQSDMLFNDKVNVTRYIRFWITYMLLWKAWAARNNQWLDRPAETETTVYIITATQLLCPQGSTCQRSPTRYTVTILLPNWKLTCMVRIYTTFCEERVQIKLILTYTGCPTTYQTRLFLNKVTTNDDIATTTRRTTDTFLFISHLRMYSCSNLVAIPWLVLELLKNCRVW
jgi:hypothetical protein